MLSLRITRILSRRPSHARFLAALATAGVAASLFCATGARADLVPGACSGGIAGTICAPDEWTQPTYAPSGQPLFSIHEQADDFPAGSANWVVTFWFRSDVPGVPDRGYEYTVGDWVNTTNGQVTPPVPTGHSYAMWATVDHRDGQGPSPLDVTSDTDGGSWEAAAAVSNPDPNQIGGPDATLCVSAADDTQVQANQATGCG